MFGAFRPTLTTLGGLLWKKPWRLSPNQKYRHRKRMQQVDSNISALYEGLKSQQLKTHKTDQLMFEFPKESEMKAKDKYFVFNKHSKGYRKGAHFVPKWTKLSLRNNPENF
ncbi:mitochondrial 54S ribosomal protein YmL31 [Martiniozyma asiatica (nom. inval.)]|nr:mitochondrial 54S ribosomal protein YmL31 [Martiniozyma asiatica]